MSPSGIRLGIIGTGIAAFDLHWPALKSLADRFQIVAVANRTEEKARRFAALVGRPKIYGNYQDLLRDPAVEAVTIALPIHLNHRVAWEALKAGKHVLLEKPVAGDLRKAQEMVGWPQRFPGLKMMVAENYRFSRWFWRLKERLDSGEIGRPFALRWDVFALVRPETNKYARTQWRLHHQYPGGFILDGGVHNAAVFRLLGGEVESVFAATKSVNPAIGEIDTLIALLSFASGLQGQLNLFYSSVGDSANVLTVWGETGTFRLLVGDGTLQKIGESGKTEEEKIVDDGGYRAEYENFYDAIRRNAPIRSSFEEGYQDLQLIFTALQSAKEKRVLPVGKSPH